MPKPNYAKSILRLLALTGILISIDYKATASDLTKKEVETKASSELNDTSEKKKINHTEEDKRSRIKLVSTKVVGPINGSGVIIGKDRDEYTVITAWHVVRSIGQSEEAYINTHDGKTHRIMNNSITRIGNYDLATLKFTSNQRYKISMIGSSNLSYGEEILSTGFPYVSNTLSINDGLIAFSKFGNTYGESNTGMAGQGYFLMYTSVTQEGMSGGGLFDKNGELVGIHGRGQRDFEMSVKKQDRVKSGMNYGLPISLYTNRDDKQNKALLKSMNLGTDLFVDISALFFFEISPGFERQFIDLANKELEKGDQFGPHYLKAKSYAGIGDYINSLNSIDDALKAPDLSPMKSAEARRFRAMLFMNQRKFEQAIDDFRFILKDPPNLYMKIFSSLFLSEIYWKQGDKKLSQQLYDEVERTRLSGILDPFTISIIYNFNARNHNSYGNYQAAIEVSREALSMPVDPGYRMIFKKHIGLALTQQGKYKNAILVYEEIINESPFDLVAREGLGFAYLKTGDLESASKQAETILQIEPRSYLGHNLAAFINKEINNLPAACQSFSKIKEAIGEMKQRKSHQWFAENCS